MMIFVSLAANSSYKSNPSSLLRTSRIYEIVGKQEKERGGGEGEERVMGRKRAMRERNLGERERTGRERWYRCHIRGSYKSLRI